MPCMDPAPSQYANNRRQSHEAAEWRKAPPGVRFWSMMSRSIDPQADAQGSPLGERRGEQDRRADERRRLVLVPSVDRRSREKQRRERERRTGRGLPATETVEEHVRNALQLLMTIADTTTLDDELRRDLDAAMFRLHFAIERLRRGDP